MQNQHGSGISTGGPDLSATQQVHPPSGADAASISAEVGAKVCVSYSQNSADDHFVGCELRATGSGLDILFESLMTTTMWVVLVQHHSRTPVQAGGSTDHDTLSVFAFAQDN